LGKPIEVLEVYRSKRKHEINAASFYNWKAKYGALLHRR